MINVENWEERKAHHEAYWSLQNRRAVIELTATKEGGSFDWPAPENLLDYWYNTEWMTASQRHWMKNTYYGLDAYPFVPVSIGPDLLAGMLGLELQYNEASEWVRHRDCELAEFTDFTLREDNYYYREMERILQAYTEDAKSGDYIIGTTDLNTLMDGVAALVGSENTCYEMMDNPEEVVRVQKAHLELFKQVYARFQKAAMRYQGGCTNWLGVYSERPAYFISNDFEVMLSAEMWEEFVREPLRDMAAYLGRCLFHLDGENVIRHLPAILSIPEITGVQVQATPAAQNSGLWIPRLKEIQAAGKCAWVEAVNAGEVMDYIRNLQPEGLFIRAWVDTEAEARQLEQAVDAYYRSQGR
ncbi:MAG: hypothetical protein HDR26_05885 [Lachnospiraceae bacterium]|nr:hypothetical protein [Lachnospiraceae bacterium]